MFGFHNLTYNEQSLAIFDATAAKSYKREAICAVVYPTQKVKGRHPAADDTERFFEIQSLCYQCRPDHDTGDLRNKLITTMKTREFAG